MRQEPARHPRTALRLEQGDGVVRVRRCAYAAGCDAARCCGPFNLHCIAPIAPTRCTQARAAVVGSLHYITPPPYRRYTTAPTPRMISALIKKCIHYTHARCNQARAAAADRQPLRGSLWLGSMIKSSANTHYLTTTLLHCYTEFFDGLSGEAAG